MKAEIQVYNKSLDERQAILDQYELAYQEWQEKDQYAKGEMPKRPEFSVKFCPGRLKVNANNLLCFYVIDAELIRVETTSNYYNIRNTAEALAKLEELIPE